MKINKKENLFYIDSIEGFNIALKSYNPNKDILVTDNPFIANDPKTKNYIVDMSKLLLQTEGNKIGNNILLMSNEIEKIFIQNNYNNIFNYFEKKIGLYLVIKTMVNTTIEKSLMFNLLLKKYSVKKLYFIINKSDYYDKNHPWIFPRFSNIY